MGRKCLQVKKAKMTQGENSPVHSNCGGDPCCVYPWNQMFGEMWYDEQQIFLWNQCPWIYASLNCEINEMKNDALK